MNHGDNWEQYKHCVIEYAHAMDAERILNGTETRPSLDDQEKTLNERKDFDERNRNLMIYILKTQTELTFPHMRITDDARTLFNDLRTHFEMKTEEKERLKEFKIMKMKLMTERKMMNNDKYEECIYGDVSNEMKT